MSERNLILDVWQHKAVIAPNNFVYKSLSEWSYNVAVGCSHACRFCYVPSTSAIKLRGPLKELGVDDPDAQWGQYAFPREWDEDAFVSSMRSAINRPQNKLTRDGNRAVMLCTTTDPYMALPGEEGEQLDMVVEKGLWFLCTQSDLNVRILTRGPLARKDFKLMKAFGNRLLFGMSLPTLDNKLARIYEPHAPAPSQRLATLQAAKALGLNVYVAMAPVYPDCDEADMLATCKAIADLDPVTVFMEPINIRADNVARIESHAASLGMKVKTDVFKSPDAWHRYAVNQMMKFLLCAEQAGIKAEALHLWPDKSLARNKLLQPWLDLWWNRVSRWPR